MNRKIQFANVRMESLERYTNESLDFIGLEALHLEAGFLNLKMMF